MTKHDENRETSIGRRLLRQSTLAVALDCHERTIQRMTAAGIIPVVYIGDKLARYELDRVIEALESRGRR